MKNTVLWDVMPCSVTRTCRHFRGMCSTFHQNCWEFPTRLHGVTFHKTVFFILTNNRTSSTTQHNFTARYL